MTSMEIIRTLVCDTTVLGTHKTRSKKGIKSQALTVYKLDVCCIVNNNFMLSSVLEFESIKAVLFINNKHNKIYHYIIHYKMSLEKVQPKVRFKKYFLVLQTHHLLNYHCKL